MISLSKARKAVREICGDEFPWVYTIMTLRKWSNKKVISRIEVEDGKAAYPDIVIAEILTAIRLKKSYKLDEIAEARNCLDLDCGLHEDISKKDLIRFINLKRTFSDKRMTAKSTMKQIDSTEKIRELSDELAYEDKKLKIISDYLDEFLKAKKEVKRIYAGGIQ